MWVFADAQLFRCDVHSDATDRARRSLGSARRCGSTARGRMKAADWWTRRRFASTVAKLPPRLSNGRAETRPYFEKGIIMNVLDEYLVDASVSFLARTRIQAQVLVPVLRALRAELGKDKADAIVKGALRDWSRQLFAAIGEAIEGSPRRKWATVQSAYNDVTVPGIESKMHRRDKEALEFDVTRCPYAEFFRALGEPELGSL